MWNSLGSLEHKIKLWQMCPPSFAWLHCICGERTVSFPPPSTRHSHGCLRNQHLCHQPQPPFFPCSIFLPISRYHSSSPGLSLTHSFSFYLGRHPGQSVALRISLKGCWWSTLPSLSKCAQVHLSVHCLEMDNWSWTSKEKSKRERDGRGMIYIFVFQMKEKVDLESLNSFCEVKTLSKNKTKHWTVLFQLLYAYLGHCYMWVSLYSDRYICSRFLLRSAAPCHWQSTWRYLAHW